VGYDSETLGGWDPATGKRLWDKIVCSRWFFNRNSRLITQSLRDGLACPSAFLADFGAFLHAFVSFFADGGAVLARFLASGGGRLRHESAAGANPSAHRAELRAVDAVFHRQRVRFVSHERMFGAMRVAALAFLGAFEAGFRAASDDFRIELRSRHDGFLRGEPARVRRVPHCGDHREGAHRTDA
jgi:hypothetical protein